MIKVTTRDGTEMYLNPDLIEIITETPDTHITLSNGNRYLVLEPARVVIDRIVAFKAHVFRQASSSVARRYLRRRDAERYHPNCKI
ncbi:flagellar FlbD family protein [Geomonas edaphica]|uniref:flagellar FlbD family protein n=1 Tax=Geomonas edaphica TaxID=2570226 RepID=UPI0010A77387|nr:flagellar FlbD family protein [Geomonas edaphica]